MVVEEEVEGGKLVAGDLRTGRVLNDIGNDITSYLKFTVECLSTNANGWMPITHASNRGDSSS